MGMDVLISKKQIRQFAGPPFHVGQVGNLPHMKGRPGNWRICFLDINTSIPISSAHFSTSETGKAGHANPAATETLRVRGGGSSEGPAQTMGTTLFSV